MATHRQIRPQGTAMTHTTQTPPIQAPGSGTPQARGLQATLVELIDLSLQAKQAHWNLVGPAFKPAHAFLDELTEQFREWYDMVAERLTAIGAAPDGRSATVAASSPLPSFPAGPIADRLALETIEQRVAYVADEVRTRAQDLADDLATQDVLVEILRGLEQQRWMLAAHRA
jgi:starvation-inducible DNA-binding protein